MQDQMNGTAGLATLEAAQPLGWRAAAIGECEQSLPTRHAKLRTDLAARILALTGRHISPEDIYTNAWRSQAWTA